MAGSKERMGNSERARIEEGGGGGREEEKEEEEEEENHEKMERKKKSKGEGGEVWGPKPLQRVLSQ